MHAAVVHLCARVCLSPPQHATLSQRALRSPEAAMRVTRRFLRFGTAALPALVANAPAISAQTPPGPGWEGRTCPRTLTNRVVRANAGANFDEFFWTIGTLQLQRYVGATNHAQYAVFPSNTAQRSSPNGNKTADWTGGQVDFYCWEKHTLLNNVPTTDYLYKQG